MRSIINFILLVTGLSIFLAACDKVDDLPVYGKGTAATMTASTATIAPAPADSNNVALTLRWTNPNYATDTSNYKYTIEIDSTGKNFSKPFVKEVVGQSGTSFTAKELNSFLLSKGYAFNVPVDMDVRLTTSYANNNERIVGNTVKIRMTPYKVPPKVALPSSGKLFITGGDFGWSNSNPMPAYQQLTKLDETQYAGIFHFGGGQSYLLLGVAGGWDEKFGGTGDNNTNVVTGDNFKSGGGDLKSPAEEGDYMLTVDFQSGKFTVAKVNNPVPQELYILGDATAGGWDNNPPAAQKFTAISNGVFEITIALEPGKMYKFISSPGNWQPQFGGSSATGGDLGANYGNSGDPDAIPTPAAAGNYKIQVNFITNSYTVTKL